MIHVISPNDEAWVVVQVCSKRFSSTNFRTSENSKKVAREQDSYHEKVRDKNRAEILWSYNVARTAGYIELFWVKTWNVIHIHNLFIMYLYQCDICIKTSTKEVKINCCENKDFCYIISKIVFIIFIKIYWISSLVSQIMVITLNKEWH